MPFWILSFEMDLVIDKLGAWHIDIQFEWMCALLRMDTAAQSHCFYFNGG